MSSPSCGYIILLCHPKYSPRNHPINNPSHLPIKPRQQRQQQQQQQQQQRRQQRQQRQQQL